MTECLADEPREVHETLIEPAQLSFGAFSRKTTFLKGTSPRRRLRGDPHNQDFGMDAIVLGLRKADGGQQVVEIFRRPDEKHESLQGVKTYGNPQISEFLLVVHDEARGEPELHFILNTYVGNLVRTGDDFLSDAHQSLAEIFEGSVVEEVIGFSRSV